MYPYIGLHSTMKVLHILLIKYHVKDQNKIATSGFEEEKRVNYTSTCKIVLNYVFLKMILITCKLVLFCTCREIYYILIDFKSIYKIFPQF